MADGDTKYVGEQQIESDEDEVVFNFRQLPMRGPTPPIENHGKGDEPGTPNKKSPWNKPVKIEYYSGEQPWPVWHRMFEKIAMLNGWKKELPNRLFAHLKGPALEVACSMPDRELEDYTSLVTTLDNQFGPAKQSELHLAELRSRKKKSSESFRELGRDIRKLSGLAYSTASYEERERLARVHFIDAIPEPEIKFLILQRKTSNLDEAVQAAEEIAGYKRWIDFDSEKSEPRQRGRHVNAVSVGDSFTECMKQNTESLKKVEETLAAMLSKQEDQNKRNRGFNQRNTRCYNCNQLGHLRRDCPAPITYQGNANRPSQRDVPRS